MEGECAEPYQRNDGANQHGTCFSGTAAALRDIQMLTAVPKNLHFSSEPTGSIDTIFG
jgi:hypothetical protein